MSTRKPKFKIKFESATDENGKDITNILLNDSNVVGHIYPPNHSSHKPEFHTITLLQRVIDSPCRKSLKPVFTTDKEAREYVLETLEYFHNNTPLYISRPEPVSKKRRKRKGLPLTKLGESWADALLN